MGSSTAASSAGASPAAASAAASSSALSSAARSLRSARAWRGGRARRSTSPTLPAQCSATRSHTRIIAGGITTSSETRRVSDASGRSVVGSALRSSTIPSVSLPEKRTRTRIPGPAAAVSGVTAYSKGRSRCGSTPTRRMLATGSCGASSKPAVVRRPPARASAAGPGAEATGTAAAGAGASKRPSCSPAAPVAGVFSACAPPPGRTRRSATRRGRSPAGRRGRRSRGGRGCRGGGDRPPACPGRPGPSRR